MPAVSADGFPDLTGCVLLPNTPATLSTKLQGRFELAWPCSKYKGKITNGTGACISVNRIVS